MLAEVGTLEPSAAEAAEALRKLRANGGIPPEPEAPSAAAIQAMAGMLSGMGLSASAAEITVLARRFADAPPPSSAILAQAWRTLRRPALRARLATAMAEHPSLPARKVDVEAALEALTGSDDSAATVLAALRGAIRQRLRGAGSVEAAAAMAADDSAALLGKPEATLEAVAVGARLAADAFGLDATAAERFAEATVEAERVRRKALRDAAAAARKARAEADRQQREWEARLVTRDAIAPLLGCSPAEAEAWLRAKRIPVARRIAKGRGRGAEELQFDPAVLATLRAEVAAWRQERVAPARANPRASIAKAAEAPVRVDNAVLAEAAAMDRFVSHFTTARALDRRITLITGPTNSGKSHQALDRLAKAESGIALAPLRLLAHEFREALAARGILASLVTGEERDPVPGSRFTAATVEMCPFNTPVDVAVIDEAQLLTDPDRGHAWTAAIMGVPAREVVVLGSPDCIPLVRRIATLTDEPVEEIVLERKSPLLAADEPIALGDLRKGDALIAFSRRDVLELRSELQRRNRRVATIYGALSPEVRRAEARRFRDTGEADILIATDAIGLGLNLPISRIVFSTLEKWDGTARRALNASEVRQIGGRAGRFGHHEEGIVAVLVGAGRPAAIKLALGTQPAAPADLRPRVAPDLAIVTAVAREMGTTSLYATLTRLQRAVLRPDDPSYRLADISAQISIAAEIDKLDLPLATRWTYALCPVDTRDYGIERLSRWALDHARGHKVRPPEAGPLPRPDTAGPLELERAEKTYKRLVAWRWLSMRFPDVYVAADAATRESNRLNDWIEAVLASHPARGGRHAQERPEPKARRRAPAPRR
jgi:ATP-dependent RNA helicase SUPV3L1/SUV3